MGTMNATYGDVFLSMDVECVATGTDHNSRSVAQVSLVDQAENVLLNLYVKPEKPVVSYLSPLTGLTSEVLEQHGRPLSEALATLRSCLPKCATLVGQNIRQDVEWLGLREGVDFKAMIDLAGLYRIWNEVHKSWSVFGQDHLAKVLLGWDTGTANHDAVTDAIKSMRLYNYYLQMQSDPQGWSAAQRACLETPVQPSFSRRNPSFESVCMGNRKTCTCGAPFFS